MSVPHKSIPFTEAASYVLQFGKHRGKTVDQIGTSDDGLLYLCFLQRIGLDFHTKNAIYSYLEDPTVNKDLVALLEKRS